MKSREVSFVYPSRTAWITLALVIVGVMACSVDPLHPATGDGKIDQPRTATDSRLVALDHGSDRGDGPTNCTPESDTALCQRFGKNCDFFTNLDNCGGTRTANCGACTVAGDSCGGSGMSNVCGQENCTPESDAAFCTRYGKNCDFFTNLDNCGESRVANCGNCISPETCGGTGITNLCGCDPQSAALFCASQTKECGSFTGTDNCDQARTELCGTCPGTDLCQNNGCVCTGGVVAAYLHPVTKTLVVATRTGYLWNGVHSDPLKPPSGTNMSGPFLYTTQSWTPNPAHVVATYIVPALTCNTGVNAGTLVVILDNDHYCVGTLSPTSATPTTWDCPTTTLTWPMSTASVAATFISSADPCRLVVLYQDGGVLKYRNYSYGTSEWGPESLASEAVWPEDVVATYFHPLTADLLVAITAEGSRYYTYDYSKTFDPLNPYANWTGHPNGLSTTGWPTPCN